MKKSTFYGPPAAPITGGIRFAPYLPRTVLLLVGIWIGMALLCGTAAADEAKSVIRVDPNARPTAELGVGDLYALVIGVSKYENTKIPQLRLAERDARDFAATLKSHTKAFKAVHVSLLTDELATRRAIEQNLIYGLRKAGKDDTIIIFLSGHGSDDPANPGEFFFLPYDADPNYIAATSVHMNRQWFMDKLESSRVLLISDACHSGGFAGGTRSKSLGPSMDKFVKQFAETEGRLWLSAAKKDEVALEQNDYPNSVFTHFLLEGMAGSADGDKDGVVTLRELYEYVYVKTKNATRGVQHPEMTGRLVGTFPIGLARPQVGQELLDEPSKIRETRPLPTPEPSESAALLKSAQGGDTDSQFKLGAAYEFGMFGPKDKELAILWYRRAADKGHGDAKGALARLMPAQPPVEPAPRPQRDEVVVPSGDRGAAELKRGAALYDSKDYAEAFPILKSAALKGSASAQNYVGFMLQHGKGVPKDLPEAVRWFQRSADGGEAAGMNNLAFMYKNGLGVSVDYQQAFKWFSKSAEHDHANAIHSLANMYQHGYGVARDYDQAMKLYKRASEKGSTNATNDVGYMYQQGYGVPRDYQQAYTWYKKAADKGNAQALRNLGYMHQHGMGRPKDAKEALRYYHQSADKGNERAMHDLGYMYRLGYGTPINYPEAMRWYKEGAKKGDPASISDVGFMYHNGLGVAKDHYEAMSWYKRAAAEGNGAAMNQIGVLYADGLGVPKDQATAVQWYRKGIEAGSDWAHYNLAICYLDGLSVPRDRQKAIELLKKAAGNGHELAEKKLKELNQSTQTRKDRNDEY